MKNQNNFWNELTVEINQISKSIWMVKSDQAGHPNWTEIKNRWHLVPIT